MPDPRAEFTEWLHAGLVRHSARGSNRWVTERAARAIARRHAGRRQKLDTVPGDTELYLGTQNLP